MGNIERILYVIIDLIQVIVIMNAIWSVKWSITKWRLNVYLIIAVMAIFIATLLQNEALDYNLGLLLSILFSYFFVQKSWKSLWLWVLLMFMTGSFVDAFVTEVVREMGLFRNGNQELFGNIMGCFVVMCLAKIYEKIVHKKLDQSANRAVMMLGSCILMTGMLVAAFPVVGGEFRTFGSKMLFSLYVIFQTAGGVLLVYYAVINREYKLREMVEKEKQQLLNEYYNDIVKNNLEIRQFRHEYKNHMRGIKILVKEQKYNQLIQYIDDMDEFKNYDLNYIDVGHEFVSAILSDYKLRLKEQGMSLEIAGVIPAEARVADVDWSIILSNGINNALEAVASVEEQKKKIIVKFSEMKNKLVITITNPVAEIPTIKDGEIKTSKADKLSHGFGIKNMKQCISKYHGSLSYKVDENEMTISANIVLVIKNCQA